MTFEPRDMRSTIIVSARRYGIILVFIAIVAFMFFTKSQFGTYSNITNVLQQNAVIGIIAGGMTFAIIVGGFDLSVGAVAARQTNTVQPPTPILAGRCSDPRRNPVPALSNANRLKRSLREPSGKRL